MMEHSTLHEPEGALAAWLAAHQIDAGAVERRGDGLGRALVCSPYLTRLANKLPNLVARYFADGAPALVEEAIVEAGNAARLPLADAMAALRHQKQALHLVVALADLAGEWDLDAVTKALTAFADAATQAALQVAGRELFGHPVAGFFILAMGKHGGFELNYSSDIDLTAFFDRDLLPETMQDDAQRAMTKLIALVARILEEVTGDGYVFRVDLRLRPDPGSTKPAVSTQAAESYYESFGQNWERAVFIKARPVAGDFDAANVFLSGLQSFIWRKHLDFAAIADVRSILAQIHAQGRHGGLDEPIFDVKLGRGGIREIEFFVQTQQLILGGRDPALRLQRTEQGLQALCDAGRVSLEAVQALTDAYRFLRGLEHRIQMLDDAQTHKLPAEASARRRIALLCGFATDEAFSGAVLDVRRAVLARVAELFPESESLGSAAGSLVFTGVEDDPETLETLQGMGFGAPKQVAETIRGWHHGRIRATRTPRARELLTALTPDLLQAIAATGDADAAFTRFSVFFAGLNAGVQLLSLFVAERRLLGEIIDTLALAPRIGEILARQPALIDAMVEPRFRQPLEQDAAGQRRQSLAQGLEGYANFEEALDRVRRAHREEAFRIGYQTLQGQADARVAGEAFADLAESVIDLLLPVAIREVERLHGHLACEWVVCGWGKLGGRELAAESDLDLMVVYNPMADESDGVKPLEAEAYANRVTQRLIAALSAPTAEGGLYDVDMQLRPSGRAGPVAVRFSSLVPYYERDAWTWERMAMTRLRPLAGDAKLARQIEQLRVAILTRPNDFSAVKADAASMRERMEKERSSFGLWDLKLAPGGLVDIEFLVQVLMLGHAPSQPEILRTNSFDAIRALVEFGVLDPETGDRLMSAGRFLSDLRQILGLAVKESFAPETASVGLRRRLMISGNAPDVSALEAKLKDTKIFVRTLLNCHLGSATGSPLAAV
jgi:glutamate-ammonia-ligase adenylyltransferase